ncbi:cAMP-responsive element-binding protein-like 2 [Saccoglossus kowalevskii]|uniref:cAMP-responsive element-binding protein-like 2-like n=1 Tax=Saccoglossus kowalevskii TaxID=10224 RepID=A0ABM0GSK0_SACKO|nr:PREDICTED: cAMP-responsive element-binding protein-like 2-like [Saccoglossus kowalevskii]
MKGDIIKKDENKGKKVSGGKVKKPGKRGRKPSKIDQKAKLERSRQSARECRARKKMRYQHLEDAVMKKEKEICKLRDELETYKKWCKSLDDGVIPVELKTSLKLTTQASVKTNTASHSSGSKGIKLFIPKTRLTV